MDSLEVLIPVPRSRKKIPGRLNLSDIRSLFVNGPFAPCRTEIEAMLAGFGVCLKPAKTRKQAQLALVEDRKLQPEAFRFSIMPDGICLEASGLRGARYGLGALRQVLFHAMIRGPKDAFFDCGVVEDSPRFGYRGFMLDSARHFQAPSIVKQVLRLMAEFRLNAFHWHLVDNQGWRLQLDATPGLEETYSLTPGFYTKAEIRDITEYAASLGIDVIPEIDMPGHSSAILKAYPQFACKDNNGAPGEFCLGNADGIKFLKRILAEVMDLFPKSACIHIGGDEASAANWEKCPLCRREMKRRGLSTMRELENAVMVDISRFVVEQGRRPVMWGTCSGQVYPADTIIQDWLDIREPLSIAPHGNKVIYSVHTSLYFDYPANMSEPWETWMFELSERGVYMTDPYVIWPEKVKDVILGTEACLWTETVPQWRVIRKILPRLFAYSECAWSEPANKKYDQWLQRRELLQAAGYDEALMTM